MLPEVKIYMFYLLLSREGASEQEVNPDIVVTTDYLGDLICWFAL